MNNPSISFRPGIDLPEVVASAQSGELVIVNLSLDRRRFLKLSGLATSGLLLAFGTLVPQRSGATEQADEVAGAAPDSPHFAPNGYLTLSPDGSIVIVAVTPEIGQGVKTAFPMVVAEELDVDWDAVTVVQSEIDFERYGPQFAGGSMGTPIHFDRLRKAGATARAMLVAAAAERWQVDPEACKTSRAEVLHPHTNERLSYAEICLDAGKQPVPENVSFKDRKDYQILGKWKPGVDNHAIVTGQPLFGYDQQLPDMRYAMYVKCPATGGIAIDANLDAIRAARGIEDAFILSAKGADHQLLSGVAIIGESSWAVMSAANQLQVKWDRSQACNDTWSEFVDRAQEDFQKGGSITHSSGDFSAAQADAHQHIVSEYSYEFAAHACLEPMNCLAHYHDGIMEIWAPSQTPQSIPGEVATVTEIESSQVKVHQLRIGGGFGRKLINDVVCEVAAIAERVPYPVKLIWTREQDMAHDFYRVGGFHKVEGTLSKQGKLSGWKGHFITFHPHGQPDQTVRGGGMGAYLFPYPVLPNVELQETRYDLRIPCGWWRAPGSCTLAWVIQGFLHELSTAAGRDHLEFLLELMGEDRWLDEGNLDALHTGRAKAVLRLAAEKGNWGEPLPEGHGRGIAFYLSHKGHFAEVAEVSVSEGRTLKLHRVVVAGDVGTILNKSGAENQIEGSIVDGYSAILGQSVTFSNGVVDQSNFHDYSLLRIGEQPQIEVHMIESDFPATGLGEPALPPLGPAVCNAIFQATGKRIRKLPLTREGFSV
ncbi:MAG: molybdopterin cofactor-binding domain-containing protein [Puniceicoccaceae bacterium]